MQHTVYVEVAVTKSGYLHIGLSEEKPEASYIGRIATHEHVMQIYANDVYGAAAKYSIIGRVARWAVSEGFVR